MRQVLVLAGVAQQRGQLRLRVAQRRIFQHQRQAGVYVQERQAVIAELRLPSVGVEAPVFLNAFSRPARQNRLFYKLDGPDSFVEIVG